MNDKWFIFYQKYPYTSCQDLNFQIHFSTIYSNLCEGGLKCANQGKVDVKTLFIASPESDVQKIQSNPGIHKM